MADSIVQLQGVINSIFFKDTSIEASQLVHESFIRNANRDLFMNWTLGCFSLHVRVSLVEPLNEFNYQVKFSAVECEIPKVKQWRANQITQGLLKSTDMDMLLDEIKKYSKLMHIAYAIDNSNYSDCTIMSGSKEDRKIHIDFSLCHGLLDIKNWTLSSRIIKTEVDLDDPTNLLIVDGVTLSNTRDFAHLLQKPSLKALLTIDRVTDLLLEYQKTAT